MKRRAGAACWLIPFALCLALYWPGLTAWFQADDFAWLNMARAVQSPEQAFEALFAPKAQGTFRVLSERAFFLLFYNLFGLDALPFHIWVFLTQSLNVALLASVARRLTGSWTAAWWACIFWVAGAALAVPMTWTSVYNQVLCATFLLAAFRWLLLFAKTGRKRYYVAQWAAFLAGLGALELTVMYPALAASYTWVFARRRFRGTLPMLAVAAIYVAVNRYYAPPAGGLYAMHFDAGLFVTAAAYWKWAAGGGWLETVFKTPAAVAWISAGIVTGALAVFVWRRARRRDWLPAFCLLWFGILLLPYLPLQDHVTDYYMTVPSLGLAVLGGYAMARAWRPAAAVSAALYLACSAPSAAALTRFYAERSLRAKSLVLGVARAAQLHPHKAIVLTGVDSDLFYSAILDDPFPLVGGPTVNLAPGSQMDIPALPGIGDPAPWVLPAMAAKRAVDRSAAVVYSAAGPRLKNITSIYHVAHAPPGAPRRVDVANPLLEYLLGPGWHESGGNHRFMAKRATLRLGGGRNLQLKGMCVAPLEVTVEVDGVRFPARELTKGEFALDYSLPAASADREWLEVAVEVSRTIRPPEDGRDLGLAFGTFEMRQ
jgi:hypothetical protein